MLGHTARTTRAGVPHPGGYHLIWFTEQSLSSALRLEGYVQDAVCEGDNDLAEFFSRAQNASRKGGEQGKKMLSKRFAS